MIDTAAGAPLRWRDGLLPTFVGWVWARLCVAAGFAVAKVMVDVLDTPRGDLQIHEALFTWDGTYYRAIAEQWYVGIGDDAARFFPVYPGLAKVLGPLFGGRTDLALIFVTNVAAFLGAWVVWRLTAEVLHTRRAAASDDDRDPDLGPGVSGWTRLRRLASPAWTPDEGPVTARATADRAAWLTAIFPAAFVLSFAYSEGLALLLVAATLLALHRRAFVAAGGLALLLAALRPTGGLILVAVLVELVRARPRPRRLDWVVGLGGPVLGLVGALVWIEHSTGDLLLPVRLQSEIRGGLQDPVTRVLEPFAEILTGDFRDVYNLGFMLVLLGLAAFAVHRRQPLSWLVYTAASLVLLLSSQVTDSLGRYGLVVVPLVVALAQWADVRWRQVLVAVGCSAGLVWLTSEALLGRMVP
ncbi:MAG: hypothetical protein REI45_14600 [Propionicimonas sp.]|nr:hypothetical protein [Propionicimonas sp.]